MDTTQLLLSVVLTVTTVLLIVVGIQLIFVIREFRRTLRKVNEIIEGFEKIGTSFEHSFSELTGFVAGVKTLFKIVDVLHAKKNSKSK